MNCQDVAKLRTPLDAVCQTTDIGCVPIVDGKPTCTVQPDELPIAFDPKTTTLWLFSCKTREWIPFQKFTVCQLNALNLENITNICDVLNIAVNYAGSGDCVQGTITLKELAERILECLTLETKIITIGQGDGNKVKISIEGLPLDPVYVQGHNIWSEGGSGTETDPLIVATYDPICKWPVKTQGQVDTANTKHLGACLDGQMSRVPFPPKVCELPSRNQAQVDAAQSKELIACVNGEGVKIPYIKPSPPVCSAPNMTLAESKAAQSTLKLVACKADGDFSQTVKIPIEGSGFFSYNTDWKYTCVPQTTGVPSGSPADGTGPFRIDCDNTLWVWDCENNGWRKTKDGLEDVPFFNPGSVPNICDNLRFKGWFANNGDPCVQDAQMTASQLSEIVFDCITEQKECNEIFTQTTATCTPKRAGGNRDYDIYEGNLVDPSGGKANLGDYKFLVYCSASDSFIVGSGSDLPRTGSDNQTGVNMIETTNNTNCVQVVTFDVYVQLFLGRASFKADGIPDDLSVTAFACLKENPISNWDYIMSTGAYGENWSYPPDVAMVSANKYNDMISGFFLGGDASSAKDNKNMRTAHSAFAPAPRSQRIVLRPGETNTMYLYGGLVWSSKNGDKIGPWPDDPQTGEKVGRSFNFGCYATKRVYRGVLI